MKPKLLITGASGFIGWNLCRHACNDWQVHGLYHQHALKIDHVQMHKADLADLNALQTTFEQIKPDAVIHLAAISSPNICQQQVELSTQINVQASEKIAAMCASIQIPCVFASSSQVFDGEHAPYTEQSPTNPVNIYGEQKLQAEQAMREAYANVTICRIPLSFGPAPSTASSFLQPMLKALQEHTPQNLFYDEYRCVLGAMSAVEGFLLALQHPGELFLMAGDESISRYDFGLRVAKMFDLDSSTLVRTSQKDIQMAAKRPADLTMDNSKIKAVGFKPYSVDEELLHAKQQMESG